MTDAQIRRWITRHVRYTKEPEPKDWPSILKFRPMTRVEFLGIPLLAAWTRREARASWKERRKWLVKILREFEKAR